MAVFGSLGLPPVRTEIKLNYNNFLSDMDKAGAEAVKKANDISSKMSGVAAVGKGFTDIGKKATMYVTVPLAAAGVAVGKFAMDYESAFAGVRKTVDATEEEYAQLSDGIRQMAKEVPTGAAAIAEVTEAAGQLGIEKENLLDFTRVMIDLGEATNLSATEGAKQLAQYANIVQMSQDKFSNLGSVVVALGNTTATTEADIVNMAMRIAGAGKQAGLTEAQTFALAATLSSVGIEAEAGGSAFSKLLIQMQVASETGARANEVIDSTGFSLRELQMMASHNGKEFGELAQSMGLTKDELNGFVDSAATLEGFSKVTGKSAAEFQKAFQEDAMGALQEFIEGLQAAEEQGISAVAILDEMGITEVRLRDSILRATGAGDLMNETIATANKAWDENNALTKEAEERYATSESQLKIMKNRMIDVGISIGEKLLPHAVKLVDKVDDVVEWFGNLDEGTQGLILKMGVAAAAFGPVTRGVGGLLTTVSKAPSLFNLFRGGLTAGTTAAKGFGGATSGLTGILGKVAGAAGTSGATGALSGLGGSLVTAAGAALPFVAAGAAVAGAGYAIYKGFQSSALPAVDLFEERTTYAANTVTTAWGDMTTEFTANTVKISEETKSQVSAFMDLKEKAESETMQMYLGLTEMTHANTSKITDIVSEMAQSGIDAVNEQKTQNIADFNELYATGTALSQDEKNEILANINEMADNRTTKIEETKERIIELYEIIREKGVENATEEKEEVTRLMNELAEESISAMARSQDEQEVILDNLRRNKGRITQQMVSETIVKLNEQRDKGVSAAQEQYDKQIKFALDYKENLRRTNGSLTKEQEETAQKMIDSAAKQRDETIKAYDQIRDNGLVKLRDEYGKLATDLDMKTGEMRGTLDKLFNKAGEWNSLKFESKSFTLTQYNKTVNETVDIRTRSGNGWYSMNYNGIDHVPYDGYKAHLHKGERVLTAKENKEYSNNARGGVNVNIENFTNNTKEDVQALVRRIGTELRRQKVGVGAL